MEVNSVFDNIPEHLPDELFEELLKTESFRLERIVSRGHSTPPGQWYDQEKNEWVMVLKGRAGLSFEGEDEIVVMERGEYIHIPAHQKHRVEWTDPKEETLWLALHY